MYENTQFTIHNTPFSQSVIGDHIVHHIGKHLEKLSYLSYTNVKHLLSASRSLYAKQMVFGKRSAKSRKRSLVILK